MKLNTSCRQEQDASDGALLFISFIDQPDAALPYVAVRMVGNLYDHSIRVALIRLFGVGGRLVFAMNSEPDKQAQESVTGRYITCNAAEPHD